MKETAKRGGSPVASETIQNNLYLSEAKLEAARAELKATKEILTEPDKLLPEAKTRLEQSVPEKEVAVRAQEILVETFRERYQEDVRNATERAVEVADMSFQQEQLKRINSVTDLLQTRLVSLQTEMSAPSQIQLKKKATLPREPDRWW